MKGIIIAAGLGARMMPHTEARPKCLLPIAGRTILDHTVGLLKRAGCQRIVVVTGHLAEMIRHPEIECVHNAGFRSNNILHSLMHARENFNGPAVVTYSDIWVEPRIYATLMETPGDLVVAADRDWQPYYEGRTHHPLSEAEKAFVSGNGRVLAMGKELDPSAVGDRLCAEFLGLMKFSAAGAAAFRQVFEELEQRLDPEAPFQRAARWRTAYVTDMFQELIDRGRAVDAALVERGWAELDTAQDYARLNEIATRQGLETIAEHLRRSTSCANPIPAT